ncbi:MAG: hypothetical protein LBL79_08650, partial [Prevotella sp.]|nr:hypothetical protein [Prevotella sp.]
MEAITVYVSETGSPAGNGSTPATSVNMTRFRVIFDGYADHTKTKPDSAVFHAFFAPGTYRISTTLTLNKDQGGVLFVLEKDTASTSLSPVIIEPTNVCNDSGSSGTEIGVFESSAQDAERGGCNITFRNIVFQGFRGQVRTLIAGSGSTGLSGHRVFSIRHNSTVLTLDNVTIKECNSNGATYQDLIGMGDTESAASAFHVFISEINIYNSSIVDNDRGTTSKLCNIRNGNSRIYNTTFSNNTVTTTGSATNAAFFVDSHTGAGNYNGAHLSRGYIAFINNTVYDSGRFGITANGKVLIANNIFAGTSTIADVSSIGTSCFNNIIGNAAGTVYSYCTTGVTGTTIGNFNTYLSYPAYTENQDGGGHPVAGSQRHGLLNIPRPPDHAIIDRVNNIDDMGYRVWDTEGFFNLAYDQMGKVRPQSRRAIGSIDLSGFRVLNGDIRIYYNSDPSASNNTPLSESIDLSKYILNYPDGFNKATANFTIESNLVLPNGSITAIPSGAGNYATTFNPKSSPPYKGEGSFTFKVSVTSDGRVYEETATVRIQVIDLNLSGVSNLPGYDGATDLNDARCKIEMKPVDFDPRYKFITAAFGTTTTINGVTVSNASRAGQVYDYHIPLVGDLNGDGRPEIVALGTSGDSLTSTGFRIRVNRIHIFNGQNGKLLHSHTIPLFKPYGESPTGAAAPYDYDSYHGSPGCMALIDSDGNKDIEVIIATGNTTSSTTSKRLYSYEFHENNNGTWTVSDKWTTNQGIKYSKNDSPTDPSFSSPIIQIVDFDADGTPEVLVYNKIFDARDGSLLLEYETLNDDPESPNSAYVGRDFKGKETWSKDYTGNSKIGFASVYDIDGDGHYEICAGGKVYYDIDFSKAFTDRYKMFDIMATGVLPTAERTWLAGDNTAEPSPDKIRKFTDARTAVADIDGDGIPEIVASYYVQANFHHDKGYNN